jgi:hypothetical protein
MSMHTPGPWQYRPHKYDDWGWVRGGVPDEDGYLPLVACARSGAFDATDYPAHRSNKTDPFEANARLIAAAPDMLAALMPFAQAADAFPEKLPDEYEFLVKLDAVPIFRATVGMFRAARKIIAKAEGRA